MRRRESWRPSTTTQNLCQTHQLQKSTSQRVVENEARRREETRRWFHVGPAPVGVGPKWCKRLLSAGVTAGRLLKLLPSADCGLVTNRGPTTSSGHTYLKMKIDTCGKHQESGLALLQNSTFLRINYFEGSVGGSHVLWWGWSFGKVQTHRRHISDVPNMLA